MTTEKTTAIAQAVEAKLCELDNTPFGSHTGRRLQYAGRIDGGKRVSVSVEQARHQIGQCLADVADRLSVDFFNQTPAVLLEQLTVMSIMKNHDTAGLLKSLINSFLLAYATPETHDQAYQCLVDLEAAKAQVANTRSLARAAADGTLAALIHSSILH